MRRIKQSRLTAILDSPRIMGIAALLGVAALVYLAYSATNGVPVVPTYDIHADVPDAAKLGKNADVRIGGTRVGQVLGIHAIPGTRTAPPHARLDLRLKKDVERLPAGTTTEVRLASVLGSKYLALVPGKTGGATIPPGGTLPLARAIPSIDTDEAFQIFAPRTRRALQRMLGELGDGVAGRGTDVNRTIVNFSQALPAVQRVLDVVADPSTNLAGFVDGLASSTAALAPVAPAMASLIDGAQATLGAVDSAGSALDEGLAALPGAEDTTTRAMVALRPSLDDAAAIARSLAPAGEILPSAARRLDATARTATPVARAAGNLAAPLDDALTAVGKFSKNPAGQNAIKALGDTDLATFGGSAFVGLGAILRSAADGQLNCNTLGLWMRNLQSTASEGDAGGNWLRMIPIVETSQMLQSDKPADDLHVNPYPREDAQECESGNEPYKGGQAIGNPAGLQSRHVDLTGIPEGVR